MKQKYVLLFLSYFLFTMYGVYSQAPTITGISSYTGVPGKQVFVYGNNFSDTVNNNTVWFGKVKGRVTAATSTQLTVTIPFGAMNGPIDVNTRGLYAKSGFDFVPTFKGNHAGFTSASKFSSSLSHVRRVNTANGFVHSSLAADFDGDGRVDFICYTSSSFAPDTIPLIYKNLNLPGRTDSFVFVGNVGNRRATYMNIADLNGDNKFDIITQSNDSVFFHKNVSTPGLIAFNQAVFIYKHLVTMYANLEDQTLFRDMNGDGKIDVLLKSKLATPNPKVYALMNNSSINSVSAATFNLVDLGSYPRTNTYYTGFCDIDYNGFPDLFIVNTVSGASVNDSVYFWVHNAVSGIIDSSTYANKFLILSWPNTSNIVPMISDLDVDGKQDLIWSYSAGSTSNGIVHKNNHVSGLASVSSISAMQTVGFVFVSNYFSSLADISGDGLPDLVTLPFNSSAGSGTHFCRNNSTVGTIPTTIFSSYFNIPSDSTSGASRLADFDNDGRTDYLVPRVSGSGSSYSNSISIRRNQLEFLPPANAGTVSVLSQTNTSATLLVNKGDGMGRAIMIGANYSLTAGDTMNSTGNYTANTQYGAGTQVHPGLYLLHLGDADTITVTGLTPNTNYTVVVIEYNSIINPRAYLNFLPTQSYLSTLPVKLVSFTAKKQGEDVLLNWQTATEENNARFDIERKTPQGEWEVVGSVKGNGTTNIPQYYHHTDNEAFTQTGSHTLFYRLNQIDYDGSEHHSPVVTVNKPLLAASINIQPNPNEGLFEVVFPSNTITGTIRVTNLLGTTLYEQPIEGNTQTLDLSSNKGLLLVQIISGNEVITKKVLVR